MPSQGCGEAEQESAEPARTLANTSATPVRHPFFVGSQLIVGNILENTDGGAGGVGAVLTPKWETVSSLRVSRRPSRSSLDWLRGIPSNFGSTPVVRRRSSRQFSLFVRERDNPEE